MFEVVGFCTFLKSGNSLDPMTKLRDTLRTIVPMIGIVASSSIAVSSLGTLSVVGAFAAAIFLGVWRVQFQARSIVTLTAVVVVYSAAWLASAWWLAVGVHSMNQSYWWTGYCAALLAALWGGAPYSVLALRIRFSNPIVNSTFWAALLSVVVHLWPHPFNCTSAIGLVSSLPLLQVVDLGGLPIVFFLLHLVSFLVVDLWVFRNGAATRRSVMLTMLTVISIWSGYGIYRMNLIGEITSGNETLTIGVIQPNIPIEGVAPMGVPGSREQLFATTRSVATGVQQIDLMVWPEIPIYFSPTNNPNDKEEVVGLVKEIGLPLLLNADMYTNDTVHGRVPFFNTEQLFRPHIDKPEEYRKNLLIPIGEYLPFESLISSPENERILSGLRRYIPGDSVTTFTVTNAGGSSISVGTPICLELLSSQLVHRIVGAGAHVIVSPANDLYFRSEATARLGLAFGAVRAVENRVPVVRVTNSGLSGWVEKSGRIVVGESLPHFQQASSVFAIPAAEPHNSPLAKELQGIMILTALLVVLMCVRIYPSNPLVRYSDEETNR
jgi:apolipoprotein N-acyltransferase